MTIEAKEPIEKMFYEKHFFERFSVFQYSSKRFSVFYYSFWRFQPTFSFCAVSPYMSFSSKQFKLLKRFEKILIKKACFYQKDFFLILAIKIIPKQFLVFF